MSNGIIIEKHPSVLCHDIEENTYEPIEYTYVLMNGDIDGFPEMSIRDRDYKNFAKNPRYEIIRNNEPDPQAQQFESLRAMIRDIVYETSHGWKLVFEE